MHHDAAIAASRIDVGELLVVSADLIMVSDVLDIVINQHLVEYGTVIAHSRESLTLAFDKKRHVHCVRHTRPGGEVPDTGRMSYWYVSYVE